MKRFIRNFKDWTKIILFCLFMLIIWGFIFFHPVILSIYTHNWLYMFWYILLIPEMLVGYFTTLFIFKIIE